MTTSDTASFTDPIFLATYGLNRITVLDYFLHPLNPFRTKARCSNDVLISQQISIGFIMQNGIGMRPGPFTLSQAEEEFSNALKRLQGEQYELLPAVAPGAATDITTTSTTTKNSHRATNSIPNTRTTNVPNTNNANAHNDVDIINSPLFTIRHVYRTSETKVTPLGIYYVLEGIIYKSPSARSLMKASVARTTQGLIDACDTLRQCQRYNPRTGYYWDFEALLSSLHNSNNQKSSPSPSPSPSTPIMVSQNNILNLERHERANHNHDDDTDDEYYNDQTIAHVLQEYKTQVDHVQQMNDNRYSINSAQRSQEEEQGIRAREKINSILLGLPKFTFAPVVVQRIEQTTK